MLKSAAPASGQSSELRVLVNWFEERRQKRPAR
jgi:hypothetical protein